jgi:DNA-binding HxlR family transcriptional regulator
MPFETSEAKGGLPPIRPVRCGGTVLALLANGLLVRVLRAHLSGPFGLPQLAERLAGVSYASLRGQVRKLREAGALKRSVPPAMPYTVENALTPFGRDLLDVAACLETWLERSPRRPLEAGSKAALSSVRALAHGWNSTCLQRLAAQPLSLSDLDRAIPELSYPAIERRLQAMRDAGQIEALRRDTAGRPLTPTAWTREAFAVLAAASRCEQLHQVGVPPAGEDVEAILLLAIPLAARSSDPGGACRLVIADEDSTAGGERRAEIRLDVATESVLAGNRTPPTEPLSWARGRAEDWLDSIVSRRHVNLVFGGEERGAAEARVATMYAAAV